MPFCRELRFVAIYALFGDLWAKKCLPSYATLAAFANDAVNCNASADYDDTDTDDAGSDDAADYIYKTDADDVSRWSWGRWGRPCVITLECPHNVSSTRGA